MNSQIVMDIKRKGFNSDFIKVSPSTYSLNPNKPKEEIKVIEEEVQEEEKLAVDGS